MLQLKNIYKTYRTKNGVTQRALNNVSLSFEERGLVFIVGKSGGGKSTLLNMIAALDKPDRGDILLWGNSFSNFKQSEYDAYRNTYIGVIFQEYNLIPALTVYQNIALALGLQDAESDERVNNVIDLLGLQEISHRKPSQISGGQAQRVAIARAVIKDPKVIIADEPTGNLDSKTGAEMFEVFKKLSETKLVIIVTHDRDTADRIGDRIIEIKDGRIHKDLVHTDDKYENAIDMVGDRLVRVPKGHTFDDFSVKELNDILGITDRDSYIIDEHDVKKVKSMNIHVKNAVEISQQNTDGSTSFFPYREKAPENKPISLIKAKMPLSAAFKLCLPTFKYKKGRLIITVISLILALLISSMITSLTYYDADRAFAKTLAKDGDKLVTVKKNAEFDADCIYTQNDIDSISTRSSAVRRVYSGNFAAVYPDASEIYNQAEVHNPILPMFYGFAEVSDITQLGLNVLYGKSSTENNSEVIISHIAAYSIIDDNVFQCSEQELIGKKIVLNGRELTVAGIFESNTEYLDVLLEYAALYGYTSIHDMTWQEEYKALSSQLKSYDGLAFVKDGFVEQMLYEKTSVLSNITALEPSEFNLGNVTIANTTSMGSVLYEDAEMQDGIYIDIVKYMGLFGREGLSVNEDGTLTDEGKATVKTMLGTFNSLKYPCDVSQPSSTQNKHRSLIYNDLNIKGVCMGASGLMYIPDADYKTFVNDSMSLDTLLVTLPGKAASNLKFIESLNATDSIVVSFVSDEYSSQRENIAIAKNVLSYILALAVTVAALLMFFFISTSIKLETRQIGILRGMGARGFDTFKTFAIEGFIISGFSLILAAFGIAAVYPLLNFLISQSSLFSMYLFVLNPLAALTMVLTAFLVTVISILIPMLRLITLTPVDAINKNETQR